MFQDALWLQMVVPRSSTLQAAHRQDLCLIVLLLCDALVSVVLCAGSVCAVLRSSCSVRGVSRSGLCLCSESVPGVLHFTLAASHLTGGSTANLTHMPPLSSERLLLCSTSLFFSPLIWSFSFHTASAACHYRFVSAPTHSLLCVCVFFVSVSFFPQSLSCPLASHLCAVQTHSCLHLYSQHAHIPLPVVDRRGYLHAA